MSTRDDLLISLCMIVKNEEAMLPACLESVRSVVDEMIMVDTGSTDSSAEIARAFGVNVIDHTWNHNFAEARNDGLKRAKGKWILVLDADEVLTEQSGKKLRETVTNTKADALTLIIRNPTPKGELQTYSDFTLTRLFRNNDQYRYERMIHEQIRPSIEKTCGVIENSDLVIFHKGYSGGTVQGNDSRVRRNLQLLEKSVKEYPDDPYLLYQLGATYKQMGEEQKAIEILRKAELVDDGRILLTETRALLYMKLSQLALAGDEYGNAVRYAKKCLAIEPNNLIGLYVIGVALLYQHKIKEAGAYLLQARSHPQLRMEETEQLDQLITFCGHR
ncbi:MAG TPA: glycosyltransferase [Balneolales bacterium]|nr:glycosyltransferase [Balneolales bacterium]